VRRASSASALVEQNDPIDVGVKVLPPPCGAAGTRSAMEDERGLAGGIAARLPIEFGQVLVTDRRIHWQQIEARREVRAGTT
jgi:hypothetical protein